MRPPIDPAVAYTVMSASAARRKLAEMGLPRRETASLTLDALHDALTRHTPPEMRLIHLITTDKGFARFNERMEGVLRGIAGRPIWTDAPLMSRSGAIARLVKADAAPPLDADDRDLEDALAGLDGERPNVLPDEAFSAYGREAVALLSNMPTGRPRAADQPDPRDEHVHDGPCGPGCGHAH